VQTGRHRKARQFDAKILARLSGAEREPGRLTARLHLSVSAMTTADHLIAALRVDAQPAAWLRACEVAGVDWDDLAVTALALGLAPLLQGRLEAWGLALPEARAQAKLAFARQAETARHAARRAQLAEVLPRLPATPIVLKGAYLAEAVYPAAGLRPMNDIDLLFHPADLPAVAAVLDSLGYGVREKSPMVGPGITKHTSTYKRGLAAATPNPYLSTGASHMIEPHRSLEEAWFGLRCDLTPGAWERSRTAEIAGQPVRVLSDADNLVHLGVHLAFHLIMGSPSFVQLADIGVFVERVRVDWEAVVARARERGAAGYVYAALRLGQQSLAAPVPADVLRALGRAAPSRVRRAAESLSVADVLRRTQQAPLRRLSQRLRRGVADRAETARWAHSPAEWLRVWWTLVDVSRTDTWQMIVGRQQRPVDHG
jgi:hypothetical protein